MKEIIKKLKNGDKINEESKVYEEILLEFLIRYHNYIIIITDNKGKILLYRSEKNNLQYNNHHYIGNFVENLKSEEYEFKIIYDSLIKQEQFFEVKTIDKKVTLYSATPIYDGNRNITNIIGYKSIVAKSFIINRTFNDYIKYIREYAKELVNLSNMNSNVLNIVAESNHMVKILKSAEKVSKFDVSVLLTGETGVGKTMLANYIHSRSLRNEEPFIEVNCGAIPVNLIESELFGYEHGAFTGASKTGKKGLIELANNGTLFLDEISELPMDVQVKLLKVIQEKTFIKVGGTKEIHIDFRIIAASNKDLEKMVKEKEFRNDLFYRINVVKIDIPPLRERKNDIFLLCKHFLDMYNIKYLQNKTISPKTMEYLVEYDWPGNVREVKNIIERLIVTCEGDTIGVDILPEKIKNKSIFVNINNDDKTLKEYLEELEKRIILESYKKYGTAKKVGEKLGLSESTALRRIRKYLLNIK